MSPDSRQSAPSRSPAACSRPLANSGRTVECDQQTVITSNDIAAGHVDAPRTPSPSFPLIEGFEIAAQIGQGGMGHVFCALQRHPIRRQVALKVIRTEDPSTEAVTRFLAERQAMASMNHENIARVFDAGVTPDGAPWFSMELIEDAVSITDFANEQQLGIDQRLCLFQQVCRAVQHAHHKGVIHRDLKPTNILITQTSDRPLVKVIDFGLAKTMESARQAAADRQTEAGQVLGTPEYMSPDQVRLPSAEIDTRTDVYSLGVVLYELLTGRTPLGRARIRSSSIHDVLLAIVDEAHTPPSRVVVSQTDSASVARCGLSSRMLQRRLQGDLDCVVDRALQKAPQDRYDSPTTLADDVQRHLQHEVISARAVSPGIRMQKLYRKHTLLVTGTGLVSVAVLLGLLTFGGLWLHVSQLNQTNHRLAAQKAAEAQRAITALAESERLRSRITISVSQAQWKDGDNKAALQSLWSIPADCRNIEWGLLNQRYQGHARALYGHTSGVTCLGLRADGQMFASGSWDGVVECRSLPAPFPVRHRLLHASVVRDLAFSPAGRWLLTCPREGSGILWDSESGRRVCTLTPPADSVRLQCCCFSVNGESAYLGTEDGRILQFATQTGQLMSTWKAHQAAVLQCLWTSIGLLSVGADNKLMIRTPTGDSRPLSLDPLEVRCLAVHEDSHTLVVAGASGVVQFRDLRDPKGVTTRQLADSTIFRAVLSDDGRTLYTAHFDSSIRVHSLDEGSITDCWRGHLACVNDLLTAAQGRQVFSAAEDGTVRVWDRESQFGEQQAKKHSASVESLCHVPGTETFVATGFDGAISLWHWEKGFRKTLLPPSAVGRRRVHCRENLLISIDDLGCLHQWTLSGEHVSHPVRLVAGEDEPKNVATSAIIDCDLQSATRAVSLDRQGRVILWDLAAGRPLAQTRQTGDCIRFHRQSHDGEYTTIIVGGLDGRFAILDSADLSLRSCVQPHRGRVSDAVVLNDGTIISGDQRGHLCRWSLPTGQILQQYEGHGKGIEAIAVFPDTRRFLTGSWDRTVRLWAIDERRPLLTLKQFPDSARSLCIHPDGQHIAVGCRDNSVSLWNLAHPRSEAYYCFAPGPIDDLTFDRATGRLRARLTDQSAVDWPVRWHAAYTSPFPSQKNVRVRHFQNVATVMQIDSGGDSHD